MKYIQRMNKTPLGVRAAVLVPSEPSTTRDVSSIDPTVSTDLPKGGITRPAQRSERQRRIDNDTDGSRRRDRETKNRHMLI